ncbi:hypothetical protein HHE02_05600 [Helicobacter heilmannii]|uniref:Uncharacterized protein n=1 Tax=Helicobacter heilmannii TaxID=35817 RepID=A0A0K2XML2_HELHE|nr:hypothetical protein BN341_5800 [Helicobacter heilmannii ASB1.4]CRF47272.1 hypothetical protein HHE02_05600 [Helicobacter heilmannii]CRF51662.1 hypothetical protein HHE06_15500 [Helicobacter heilmannii]CRI34304.1 hypothetical protein HHE01_11500 [Helicobacter heilmannii]
MTLVKYKNTCCSVFRQHVCSYLKLQSSAQRLAFYQNCPCAFFDIKSAIIAGIVAQIHGDNSPTSLFIQIHSVPKLAISEQPNCAHFGLER